MVAFLEKTSVQLKMKSMRIPGQFTTTNGIISTINKLRIIDFDYSDHAYDNCGWVVDGPLDEVNKDCTMWGNPIGEMMYEALRYFAGEEPTSDFTYSSAAGKDDAIGLTTPTVLERSLF